MDRAPILQMIVELFTRQSRLVGERFENDDEDDQPVLIFNFFARLRF